MLTSESNAVLWHGIDCYNNPRKRNGSPSPNTRQTHHITCVRICHETITIFKDWSGMNRVTRSTMPPLRPMPTSPEVTYETTATARKRIRRARTTATAIPPALFSEHLLQAKLSCSVYPSLQMPQSVRDPETVTKCGAFRITSKMRRGLRRSCELKGVKKGSFHVGEVGGIVTRQAGQELTDPPRGENLL